MLFNSASFIVFFAGVLILYWWVFRRYRLWLLLLSGCYFYGSWDWRFLLLLFFTSGVDFLAAKKIHVQSDRRIARRWLILSVLVNLVTLGFFKYYDFFAASLQELLGALHISTSFTLLHVILPVGISFYTFQSIAYVTDVYRGKIAPEPSTLRYFAFICFFPQMVAGPIERARQLLPQFRKEKSWSRSYFESGINLLAYGYFKKVVIADNLSLVVDHIHSNVDQQGRLALFIGVLAFALQIYADFSGYTDIARGCARLLGYKLVRNFYFPYFSQSMRQFWQRWHISLSTWFRDYVYIPLGGNKTTKLKRDKNLMLTFLVSGLWHGANITFVGWGFLHGTALIAEKEMPQSRMPRLVKQLSVFLLAAFFFTLFRSPDIHHFLHYLQRMAVSDIIASQSLYSLLESGCFFLLPLSVFILIEIHRSRLKSLRVFRYNYLVNMLLFVLIVAFAVFENAPSFIYFQF